MKIMNKDFDLNFIDPEEGEKHEYRKNIKKAPWHIAPDER